MIFSYWIFVWYLLYIIKIININPKFALLCALIENIIILILMSIYKTNKKIIILFSIMAFILKIIPLYTLLSIDILKKDVIITIILFCYYLIWMKLNNKTPFYFIKQAEDLIIRNKNTLPGMIYLNKFIF